MRRKPLLIGILLVFAASFCSLQIFRNIRQSRLRITPNLYQDFPDTMPDIENSEESSDEPSSQCPDGKKGGFLSLLRQWKRRLADSKLLRRTRKESKKEPLSSDPKDVQHWKPTREFGFELESVPTATRWKTGMSTDHQFLFSKTDDDDSLIFCVIPKERETDYSKDIRNHRNVADKIMEEFAKKLLLKDLKTMENKNVNFDSRELLVKDIAGKMSAKEIAFDGNLFFFQTATHFVGAMGVFKKKYPRFDDLMERMFRNLNILPSKFSRASSRPPPTSNRTAQAVPDRRISENEIIHPQTAKRKPWELPEPEQTVAEPAEDASDAIKKLDITEGMPDVCKVCKGKGGCPKQCDRGFIVCQICKKNPPKICEKCGGTGLWRVISPYTRHETWDYCPRCYGTGKSICANRCLGGQLKCKTCRGSGLCPKCGGRAFKKK